MFEPEARARAKASFGRALIADSLLNPVEALPDGFLESNDSLLIL